MTKASTAGAAPLDNLESACRKTTRSCQVIKLEQNYRSTSAILRAANQRLAPTPTVCQNAVFRAGRGRASARARLRQRRTRGRTRRGAHCFRTCVRSANRRRRGKTLPSSTAPTTRPNPSRKRCAAPASPTKSRAAPAFRPRRDKDLCAWFRLWANNDDDPAFCAPSPRPARRRIHPRWRWANSPASTNKACSVRCSTPCCPPSFPGQRLHELHEFGHAA